MTIALLFSLGTCHVQTQSVQVDYTCTTILFNLSAEAIINARNAPLCVRCAIFVLRIKEFPFSCRLGKGFTFLKRTQNQFKILFEMCWQVLFQQREMRIYWRLCNNSEIHLWLWILWSLVVCSQNSFMLQEHVKTTKADKTRFFFARKR